MVYSEGAPTFESSEVMQMIETKKVEADARKEKLMELTNYVEKLFSDTSSAEKVD